MSETQLQGRELDRAIAEAINRPFYKAASPEYSKDLNAMHVVEVYIERRGLRPQYARALIESMGLNDKMRVERDALEADPPFFGFDCVWYPAHATAEQKARAALAVLNANSA